MSKVIFKANFFSAFSAIMFSLYLSCSPSLSKGILREPEKQTFYFDWDLGRLSKVFHEELKKLDKVDSTVYKSLLNSEILLTIADSGIILRRDYYHKTEERGNFDRILAEIALLPPLTGGYKSATFLIHFDAKSTHPLFDSKNCTGEYPSVTFIQSNPFVLSDNSNLEFTTAIRKLRSGNNLPLDLLLIENSKDYSKKRVVVENIWRQVNYSNNESNFKKIRLFLESIPKDWIKDRQKMELAKLGFFKRLTILRSEKKYSTLKDDTASYKLISEICECIK